jgi:hypothetical protein
MKTILAVGGMSRSGKSTSLAFLKTLGIPTVSTSVLLDQVIENLSGSFNLSIPSDVEQRRRHKIKIAEDVLVPVFGREMFAGTAARHIFQYQSPTVVTETIGGEEFNLLQKAISTEASQKDINYRIFRFNVKKLTELSGVDIRVPLDNAYTITNDGSVQDLYDTWLDQLIKLGIWND